LHHLLERLRSEHSELEQALAAIRARQFRTDEGRQRLSRVQELLDNHVHTEKTELYPVLAKAARQDDRLAARLKRMDDDLEIVTDLTRTFCTKYRNGELRLIEFATDHGALMTILKIRLRREEESVFPLYTELTNN